MQRLLLLLAVMLSLPMTAQALPNEFVQEGIVFDDGQVLAGAHDIIVRLYANEEGGAPLFEEEHVDVDFFDGYYAVSIGSIEELSASLFTRPSLYLGISIDGGRELAPRTAIVKVPAAFVAEIADNVVGDITPRTVSIGEALVINENGQWVGDPAGLRGPPGPPGEGADVDQVIQAILDALQEDPDLLPFLHKAQDDAVTDSTTTFDGSRLAFRFGAPANALDLGNNNIFNVNRLVFQDPGFDEGIRWGGTQARIVVAGPGGENRDGLLRIINDDLISLEDNVQITGNLSIGGAITAVQRITATVITATTANITNANITNLNGPGGRVNVLGELNLSGDVRIGNNTDFIGVIRAGGLLSGGDIRGRNITATASISANGNITAGNRLVAGNGGIWVGNVQVFDGNGNLVRRPIYQCPNGQVMRGTDNNGVAQCVAITCPVGQYLRGVDGNNRPICAADAGLRTIPARNCPAGQAAVGISANGTITCGAPRAAPQSCDEGEFVVGLAANGSVVCAEAPEGGGGGQAGQCAPDEVRANVLVCTRSSRDVRQFILPGFNFNVANGCDPNDQTQVMFVTRSGAGSVAARSAAWQNYVRNGGTIITEYSVSDEVYNALFGANVAQPGARRGSCRDNPMPLVKVNLDDPFWQANPDLNVTPANQASCGYEVGHYPGITPLGGWAANQIGVGYRDLGDGRVWLVDADWQDNQAITADSRTMMGKMMTWCNAAGGGDDEEAGLEFEGVRNNVPPAEIVGWRQCHRSLYGQTNLPIANILRDCDGDQIMYGCKATNAANWQVLAQGDRDAVFRNTGDRNNNVTTNNGVNWYFSNSYSIGFAPAGQAVTRSSCDTTNRGSNDRICWHTGGNNMNGGWRCGSNTSLNNNNGFERVIWTKDAGGGGGEPVNALRFQGIRQNVADNTLEGWRPCHTSRYGATTNGLQNVIDNDCRGDWVMMGCRQVGAASWRLLAQGRHANVFRNLGNARNSVTRENGVDFYYSNAWSMGFVEAGTGVSRNSCDTNRNPGSANRMCWHTSGDRMTSGYRCGDSFLNGNNSWERRIWVLDAGGGGGIPAQAFPSCRRARDAGHRTSGTYNIQPPGEALRRVYCDMSTDGGGWTLVAASEGQTLNDQRSNYYNDLQGLDPAGANAGVWWGLRALGNRWDMRFTCRDSVRAADSNFNVDLSFYDVPYYTEFTAGSDSNSCFSERNGAGDENPPPMRRNNLNGQVRNRGDQWNAGYLEGEDSCGDTGDFTVDFDDRGMDSNQSDGTDWGEDDSQRKCGRSGLGTGQWFIFARER